MYYLLFIFAFLPCFASVPELEQSNQCFRQIYKDAKTAALKKVGPIIISKGDYLVLIYKDQRTEVKYMPSIYHQLKAIDHIPLMLYVLLSAYENETPFTPSQKKELEAIRAKIQSIQVSLPKQDIQEQCLARTINYIDQLLVQGKLNKIQNTTFFHEMAPMLLEIASEATFFQLDALHEQVQSWKKQIPTDDWNRLAAVIMGPSMPRIGEVSTQYFSRLTGKPLEVMSCNYPWINSANYPKDDIQPSKIGRRLVYAENVATEKDALDLLATHIIDEDIGTTFFDDKMRMHCDLLSEAASKRLEEKCDNEHNVKKE